MFDSLYDLAIKHEPKIWIGNQIDHIPNFQNYHEFIGAKVYSIFDNNPITAVLKYKKLFLEFDNKEKYEKDCADFIMENLIGGKIYISIVQIGKNDKNENPFIYIEYYK